MSHYKKTWYPMVSKKILFEKISDNPDISELCSEESHHPLQDEQRSHLIPVGTTVSFETRTGNGSWQPVERKESIASAKADESALGDHGTSL